MRHFQKIVIYYFTGTGNAKMIAAWLSGFASEMGIPCQIINIAKKDGSHLKHIDVDSLIVIISPVHGFNFPPITLDFIRRFPDGKNPVVLMNTRGGLKIGNFVTPGLTGIAFMLSSFILRKKGYKVVGQIPFDMPSNWISIHPALRQQTTEFIYEKNHACVKKHFQILISNGKDFSARKNMIQDVLIAPVSFAYYFIGRYFLAKSYYASSDCSNCNECIKLCPAKAIKMINNRPFWTFKCESCMKCINHCPEDAIEVTHGLWVVVSFSVSVISTFLLQHLLPDTAQHWMIRFLLFSILLIGFMALFYRIQHVALKNPFVAKLISLTSLTHYKFWGRYRNHRK